MTPPTYSPWWRPLEWLGRFGFTRNRPAGTPGPVGASLPGHDVANDQIWRTYLEPRPLFEAWSPPQASPWSDYAKPTLFAALTRVRHEHVAPSHPQGMGGMPWDKPKPRLAPGTAVILDLPGPQSVAYGAWMARTLGVQTVPLFNNWPHPAGVVAAGKTLGALLYYVPWGAQDKSLRPAKAPPVFLLDRTRLGSRTPQVNDFDNRYYHTEADLPSGATFRRNGIDNVLYVRPEAAQAPEPGTPSASETWGPPPNATIGGLLGLAFPRQPPAVDDMDDLNAALRELRKSVGLQIAAASLSSWSLGEPEEFAPKARATPFNTTSDPAFRGFRRASAGGFGRLIPESRGGGFG